MEELEEDLRMEKEAERARENMKVRGEVLDMGGLERRDDVERTWERERRNLSSLQEVTGTIAKLERAGKAVEIVERV